MGSPEPLVTRRLYRRRSGRMLAGVAGGLADHLGVNPLALRIGFVVSSAIGGLGVLLYAAFWAVVPQAHEAAAGAPERRAEPEAQLQLVGFAALGVGMLAVAQLLGFGAGLVWPAAIVVAGAAILWRQADDAQRDRWREMTSRSARQMSVRSAQLMSTGNRRGALLRYLTGAALVFAGMAAFLVAHGALPQARRSLLPVVVVVTGIALVVGPWMLRMLRDLSDERTARIREQERIDLAGRVHDSMLQTLTLIQRRADDPQEVQRLVRHSERELRSWLYGPPPKETLRAAMAAIRDEVEDEYDVTIDLVTVGDRPATEAVTALAQAVRESVVNAAKHSGVPAISVYAEVADDEVIVFVRDRGKGFDADAVPDDRFGLKESVVGRMARHGGTATVRTSPGTGTEVRLALPLTEPART